MLDDLIGGLFTLPETQGRGHGTRLIEMANRLHDPVYVEVFEVNERAVRFYRTRGFVDHSRDVDLTTGLVALVLARTSAESAESSTISQDMSSGDSPVRK